MSPQYTFAQFLFITILLIALATIVGLVFIMSHNKSKYGKSFFDYCDDNIPDSHKKEVEKLKNIL